MKFVKLNKKKKVKKNEKKNEKMKLKKIPSKNNFKRAAKEPPKWACVYHKQIMKIGVVEIKKEGKTVW